MFPLFFYVMCLSFMLSDMAYEKLNIVPDKFSKVWTTTNANTNLLFVVCTLWLYVPYGCYWVRYLQVWNPNIRCRNWSSGAKHTFWEGLSSLIMQNSSTRNMPMMKYKSGSPTNYSMTNYHWSLHCGVVIIRALPLGCKVTSAICQRSRLDSFWVQYCVILWLSVAC